MALLLVTTTCGIEGDLRSSELSSSRPSSGAGDVGVAGDADEVAALPQRITNHTAVIWGDYVYVIGGGVDGTQLDTVYVARLR